MDLDKMGPQKRKSSKMLFARSHMAQMVKNLPAVQETQV